MKKKIIIVLFIVSIAVMLIVVAFDLSKNDFKSSELEKVNEKIAIIDSGFVLDSVNYDKEINIEQYNAIDKSTNIEKNGVRGTLLFSSLYNDKFSMNIKNDVVLIKAFNSVNQMDRDIIAQAIDYAISKEVKYIMLAYPLTKNDSLFEAIKRAQEKEVKIITFLTNSDLLIEYTNIIYVSNINEPTSNVVVDNSQQVMCRDNKCQSITHESGASAYALGFLSNNKYDLKEKGQLKLKIDYKINLDND